MSGFNISVGIGISRPTRVVIDKISPPQPEEDITDSILLESISGAILNESGSYLSLELTNTDSLSVNNTIKTKVDKSYWNF